MDQNPNDDTHETAPHGRKNSSFANQMEEEELFEFTKSFNQTIATNRIYASHSLKECQRYFQ